MADPLLYQAPLGHSVSAHRVHGWCAIERSLDEELIAWRTRERSRYEIAKTVCAASPAIDTTAEYERPCPACGREALTVTSVRVQLDDAPRLAGGWALCLHCNATPHPVMEDPRG
ncbi:hypothetical protein ACFYOF_20765 [Streptomyces sp. NPDC007148]|uniref:hypothetical protein n=1 Tax=Streptomyces sp. NPDC007148 TaxID=3364775 RepID=UPI0036BC52F8